MSRDEHPLRQAFAVAFEEWERRRRKDPAEFAAMEGGAGARPGDIGRGRAGYFVGLLDELAAGLPWALIGHPAEAAIRKYLEHLPPCQILLQRTGPNVGLCLEFRGRLDANDLERLEALGELAVILESFAFTKFTIASPRP